MLLGLIVLLLAALVVADQPLYYEDVDYDEGLYGRYPERQYQSDASTSPRFNVIRPFSACDDGSYIFISPRGHAVQSGPMILDHSGTLIWTSAEYQNAYNLRVQWYRDVRYLTFWIGDDQVKGHGSGEYVVLDEHYKEVRRINAGNGLHADLHECLITKDNTALITMYDVKTVDLSIVDSDRDPGYIWDSLFQEVDLKSGEVLFQWRASDAFDLRDSYNSIGQYGSERFPWDWYHINSVEKDRTGNYMISSRYLHHVAYISAQTGQALWTLGGMHSNFSDLSNGSATNFVGQHDARWVDEHKEITLFDNGAYYMSQPANHSRGMRIAVDLSGMTATLQNVYVNPAEILSLSQGSMQRLPNDNVLLGYGFDGAYTEFARNGTVLCDVRFQPLSTFKSGDVQNYRAMKQNWTGYPEWPPRIAYYGEAIYFSWLGSTEVRSWLLQDGSDPQGLENRTTIAKESFETVVEAGSLRSHVRVVAQDAHGLEISKSDVFDLDQAKVKFREETTARFKDSWGLLFTASVLCIAVFTNLTLAWVACGPRMTRWLVAMHAGEQDDDGDSDSDWDSDDEDDCISELYRATRHWTWTLPWQRRRDKNEWSFASLQQELQMRQRAAARDNSLDLSDTDISDDEEHLLKR